MDCDRILVMESGKAVEVGTPHDLIKDSNGYLRKLVDNAGESTSKVLKEIAFNNHVKNSKKEI